MSGIRSCMSGKTGVEWQSEWSGMCKGELVMVEWIGGSRWQGMDGVE